ncbi:MAG: hypothetical protein ACRDSJ_14315 [Rubrobacteraceae bacterium]
MSEYVSKLLTVAIFGGDPVVGETLELLLRAAGYEARFLAGEVSDELLAGAKLLLIAPGAAARDGLLESGIPVMELVTAGREAGPHSSLRWPCRIEELKQAIDGLIEDRI